MIICEILNTFIQNLSVSNLLTFIALLLAYVAYTWSVNRDLDSWKSLFISLKKDLEGQSSWLGSEYFVDSYLKKHSFNPYKIIYPLSFESLPEIIKRGVAEIKWIPDNFINNISLFNERVIAFNQLLDYLKLSATANPIVSEKLKDKLNTLGIDNEDVPFEDLKKSVYKEKNKDEILYLAEQVRRLNKIAHIELIGNKENKDKLHYLYTLISSDLDEILEQFDSKKPFFIKKRSLIIVSSIALFILLEAALR